MVVQPNEGEDDHMVDTLAADGQQAVLASSHDLSGHAKEEDDRRLTAILVDRKDLEVVDDSRRVVDSMVVHEVLMMEEDSDFVVVRQVIS